MCRVRVLTVRLGEPGETVELLVCDEVGETSEQAAAQLTLEDGVHLLQQDVSELCGACQRTQGGSIST